MLFRHITIIIKGTKKIQNKGNNTHCRYLSMNKSSKLKCQSPSDTTLNRFVYINSYTLILDSISDLLFISNIL